MKHLMNSVFEAVQYILYMLAASAAAALTALCLPLLIALYIAEGIGEKWKP